MGLVVDLEAAASEPFHAMEADTYDAASCSSPNADNDPYFLPVCPAVITAVSLCVPFAMAAVLMLLVLPECSYSVELTGYEGIDPGAAARIVSPSFSVTLRVNDTCVDSAHVAVTYSGVALGWARVEPRDCAEGRWGKDVEVVARGGRVGLSQRLRDRMASDWRSGAVELDVSVMMYPVGGHIDTDIPWTFDGKVN
jgi:hypothetical protein